MAADPANVPVRLDPEAAGAYVGELFERHGRLVLGVCRLLLRDFEEAEDATQQTFLSAYRSLLTGHEPREPAAWLGTIARNECRIRIRARMDEPLYAVQEATAEAGPEPEAVRHEEIAALTDALARLPQRQREAIVLREFYGLSHDDVALALGVSASAVDALLVRARKRLQKELRPARVSSAALALPLALRDVLGEAIPGFLAGGSSAGITSKLGSLPLLAKLAGATATVAVVGVAGGGGVHEQAPLLPTPSAAAATADSPRGGLVVKQEATGAGEEPGGALEDEGDAQNPDGDEREDLEREDDDGGESEPDSDAEGSDDETEGSREGGGGGEDGEDVESESSETAGGPGGAWGSDNSGDSGHGGSEGSDDD